VVLTPWDWKAPGVAMPSPGDCVSPLGEVPGLSRRFRPSCRVQRPDWTDHSVHRTAQVGSQRVRMEAWHIAPFPNRGSKTHDPTRLTAG
jgi:hypothetical protein